MRKTSCIEVHWFKIVIYLLMHFQIKLYLYNWFFDHLNYFLTLSQIDFHSRNHEAIPKQNDKNDLDRYHIIRDKKYVW